MAYKALIFGTDDRYPKLKPFYDAAAKRGTLEIVATVDDISKLGGGDDLPEFDIAIISAHKTFYQRIEQLESVGIPRDKIIDGRVFQMPNLDFTRLLKEGVAYGTLKISETRIFVANSRMIYPKVYKTEDEKITLSVGVKSYIRKNSMIEGIGIISLGNFCSFSKEMIFSLGQNATHNYLNVGTVPTTSLDWVFPVNFRPPQGTCKILIGNDVWCGHRGTFKVSNPNKPLIIGNGAVIASDSVVVKNVPPYAIVGGNPAQIIKYRFPPEIIEAFLRIKWWDWSLDKIHDNFKYFNDVEKFVSLHDK